MKEQKLPKYEVTTGLVNWRKIYGCDPADCGKDSGAEFVVYTPEGLRTTTIKLKCGDRIECKTCATKLARKHAKRVDSIMADTLDTNYWHWVTFTLPGSEHPIRRGTLKEQLDYANRAWEAFVSIHNDAIDIMPMGAIKKVEVTWNQKMKWWHTHIHALVFSPWWNDFTYNEPKVQQWLLDKWVRYAGFGQKYEWEPYDSEAGVQYLSKYINKPAEAPEERQAEFKAALKGRRLITYSGLSFIKTPPPLAGHKVSDLQVNVLCPLDLLK